MKRKRCLICWIPLGIFLAILGIILIIVVPIIVSNVVKKKVPLTAGGFSDSVWSRPPYELYMDIWMFNVTNPNEVLHLEKQMKVNIARNDTVIQYQNIKEYIFNSATSCPTCSDSDIFVVPNLPYLTVINLLNSVQNMTQTVRTLLNSALMILGERPFVAQNVSSLLFEGYRDQIFTLFTLAKKLLPDIPLDIPDKMGFFYPQNLSCDGTYVIDSGYNDVENVGKILLWNGNTSINDWLSPQANMINGSDGTVFPPFLKKSSVVQMFITQACRSFIATYYSEVKHSGIKGYRFIAPKSNFDYSLPQNEGFCLPTTDLYYPQSQMKRGNSSSYCLANGLMNITNCYFGAPVVLSLPHFAFTTEEVVQSVVGIARPSEDDIIIVDLEPTTGVIMYGCRRIQVNVAMNPNSDYSILKHVTPVIVPILFLNESARMSNEIQNYLYTYVVLVQNVAYGIAYTSLAVGLLILSAIGIIFLIIFLKKRRIFNAIAHSEESLIDKIEDT